jgi:hypothetical protein
VRRRPQWRCLASYGFVPLEEAKAEAKGGLRAGARMGSKEEGSPTIVKDPSEEDHEDDNNDDNVFKDGDVGEFWMNGQCFDIHTMLVLFDLVEVATTQALLEGDVGELAYLTQEKMRKRRQSPTCVSRISESLEIPGSRQKGIINDAGSRKKGTNNDVGSRKKGTNNYAGSRKKMDFPFGEGKLVAPLIAIPNVDRANRRQEKGKKLN